MKFGDQLPFGVGLTAHQFVLHRRPMSEPLGYVGIVNSKGYIKTYVPLLADVTYVGSYVLGA